MYMKGKFRLQKIAALSLVFVLLMNTLTAALAPVFAMEMDTIPNILMDVGITDEAGNILDENQVEGAESAVAIKSSSIMIGHWLG